MKKTILFLILFSAIVYAQPKNTTPDSLAALRVSININVDSLVVHRTDINNNTDSLVKHLDTLQALRTDINNVSVSGNYLLSAGDTLEGDLEILSDTELKFGTGYPYMRMMYDDSEEQGVIIGDSKSLNIYTASANSIFLGTNNTDRWELTSTGHFAPKVTNTYDIGSSSILLRNLYTTGLTTTTMALSGTATVTGTLDATNGKVLIGSSAPTNTGQLTYDLDQGESGLHVKLSSGELFVPDDVEVQDMINSSYTYNQPETITTGDDTLNFTTDRNFIKSIMTVAADNNLNLYFANSGYGSITIWVIGGWNPSGTINWNTSIVGETLMWVGGVEPPLDTSTSSQLFIINFTKGTSTIIVGQWNYAE